MSVNIQLRFFFGDAFSDADSRYNEAVSLDFDEDRRVWTAEGGRRRAERRRRSVPLYGPQCRAGEYGECEKVLPPCCNTGVKPSRCTECRHGSEACK